MTTVMNTIAIGSGRLWRLQRQARQNRLPWIPIVVMGVMMVCAIFAPLLAPHDPNEISLLDSRIAPGEDWSFPLGTDTMGRDMLSRLIFGAQTAAKISLLALAVGTTVGTVIGLVAGYKGGILDAVLMRAADVALGFPTILVALIVVVILGAGIYSIIIAMVVTIWARFARMIRGDVLAVRNQDFVTLAKIAGVSTPVIMIRHIFPNTINTLMVVTSILVGQVILLEAALSFLGLGLAPGAAAWGIMVSEGREVIVKMWWLSLFPGVAITILVLALNFFGDWLRDTLDPKLRRA
jgi:peptide/nickel transport system permease protein